LEFAAKNKPIPRDRFLAKFDGVTPWLQLHDQITPFYPNVEGAGRPPIGLARIAAHVRCAAMLWPIRRRHRVLIY
jgi:IS5 family transposase